jgi:hypothetical protein
MNTCNATCKTLCANETCTECFGRSFASHEKAACWSARNALKPREVLRSSNKKYWFDCADCGHSSEMIVKMCQQGNGASSAIGKSYVKTKAANNVLKNPSQLIHLHPLGLHGMKRHLER